MNSTRNIARPVRDVLARSQNTNYVCRSCRYMIQQSTFNGTQQKRHASNNIPFTEKLRRKIWGTDNPPGLKDPYGGPSFLERRQMRKKMEREEQRGEATDIRRSSNFVNESDLDAVETEVSETTSVEAETYTPAETWDGLMHMGHKGHWTDLEPRPADEHTPWLSTAPKVAANDFEIVSCLHEAIVECLSCESLSIKPETALFQDPKQYGDRDLADVNVTISSDGTMSGLQFSSEGAKTLLDTELRSLSTKAQSHQKKGAKPQLVFSEMSYYAPQDTSFRSAKLDFSDPITFTILKRFSQLSGHRIPDPVLNALASSTNPKPLSHLLDHVIDAAKPKPKNVAEKLMQRVELRAQGNVMILPRRETPVDKEKETGRWKIIEQELTARGLPVLGRVRA